MIRDGDVYLDQPKQWAELARLLRNAGIIGLDTEFYGLDVRKESCVGKARVHVWSVAIRTPTRSPRGFARARGFVLPAAALEAECLRDILEDGRITKCVHNQPVDDHALNNHRIALRGCINTLGKARWKWPGLVSAGGFGLKNLMRVKLGRAPICEFKDVVSFQRPILVSKWKTVEVTECSCGKAKCRKRKPEQYVARDGARGEVFVTEWIRHDKTKRSVEVETVKEKIEKGQYPLESIVPGHERWDLLVRYAAEDAVAALEIDELLNKEGDPAPFPFGERPEFSQAVEDAVVAMERVGFPVDVPWCRQRVVSAEADEAKALEWLSRWYALNPIEGEDEEGEALGEKTREGVDAIWSSPKQLTAYFDYLGFPHSPIWKKGHVKRGETKLDATALEWIGRNHPVAAKLIKKLLRLKRIRSGLKYLRKLAGSGGHVNPICGPAGDADDRNGAVTGRLGIKGTLEAQQLPTQAELDLYQVRRAIVANHVIEEEAV